MKLNISSGRQDDNNTATIEVTSGICLWQFPDGGVSEMSWLCVVGCVAGAHAREGAGTQSKAGSLAAGSGEGRGQGGAGGGAGVCGGGEGGEGWCVQCPDGGGVPAAGRTNGPASVQVRARHPAGLELELF